MYKCFNLTPPPGDEEEDPEMYNFHQAVDMLQEAQDMLVDEHQQCISVRSMSCHRGGGTGGGGPRPPPPQKSEWEGQGMFWPPQNFGHWPSQNGGQWVLDCF